MPDMPDTPDPQDRLAALLAREPFAVLDGGFASELEARGCDLADPLWSAALLLDPRPLDDPASGRARLLGVHDAYLDAGADIVTTASYQATLPGLLARGCSEDRARALLRETVALARQAIANTAPEREVLVAASIGSYGAYLADGSEFRGDYALSRAALVEFHRERVVELSAAAPDLLAFETLPSAVEAAAIAELLSASSGPRAWVSFSLHADARRRTRICDGATLAEAAAPLLGHPRIAALGVNCVVPERVGPALTVLTELAPGLPLIAYPNAGERWSLSGWTGERTSEDRFVALAREWWRLGARLIGGCCRTQPSDIAALVDARRRGWLD